MIRLPVERAEIDIHSLAENRVIKHIWDRKAQKSIGALDSSLLLKLDELDLGEAHKLGLLGLQTSKGGWKIANPKKGRATPAGGYAHAFLPTNRLYSADAFRRAPGGKNYSEQQLDEAFAENVNKTWLFYYAKILSEVRVIQEEGLRTVLYHGLSESKDVPMGPILEASHAYERVDKFLKRHSSESSSPLGTIEAFTQRYRNEPNLQRIVDNLSKVEERIEIAMTPIENFISTINYLYSRGKKIKSGEKGLNVELENGNIISPASLSSGEKHLLKILLAGMVGRSNSVIIDEPELSMHIDWQRNLVKTIHALNPECQLIFASHSPEIMAEIPDENIFQI